MSLAGTDGAALARALTGSNGGGEPALRPRLLRVWPARGCAGLLTALPRAHRRQESRLRCLPGSAAQSHRPAGNEFGPGSG